jgi:hypothetical protein
MDAVDPRLLPDGGLIEPLAVSRLLARCLRLNGLERPEQLDAPRADLLAQGAGLQRFIDGPIRPGSLLAQPSPRITVKASGWTVITRSG